MANRKRDDVEINVEIRNFAYAARQGLSRDPRWSQRLRKLLLEADEEEEEQEGHKWHLRK